MIHHFSPLLAAYLHDLSPILIGPLRWYGLSYMLGFIVAYLIIGRISKIGNAPLTPANVQDLITWILVGVIVGGRLGYVLLYKPSYLWTFENQLPYWNLLAVNQGGMASHGGLVGVVIACVLFARRNKLPWLHVLDLCTFAGPPGIFFGRIANFINGELYGRACSADFALAVKFPQEMYEQAWFAKWGSKLYDTMASVAPSHVVEQGSVVPWAIDQVQAGQVHIGKLIEPMLTPRHPSQLYQAMFEGLLLFIILAIFWIKPRTPGLVFGLCMIVYSIARIVGELFRKPDEHIAHLEAATLGITRGQWLSAILLLVGIAFYIFAMKQNTKPMGGWRRK